MKKSILATTLFLFFPLVISIAQITIVDIKGSEFYINGKPTYEKRYWNGIKVEGLLLNSRMVQGIFDDLSTETRSLWKYPDTGIWDPDRNTNEFVEAMKKWRDHGLLAFTLNIQGGSPTGYGNKNWINPGFHKDGTIIKEYFNRLDRIMKRADDLGMVVILGIFYFGQDEQLEDNAAVINAVNNTIEWLFEKNYRNVLIEICNETDVDAYDHEILKPERISGLIDMVKAKKHPVHGYRYLVSTSFKGHSIPTTNVLKSADFVLIHGNGVSDPADITKMVENTRTKDGYHDVPILFNEDDHYNFDKPVNNFINAIKAGASWGYFDFRKRGQTLQTDDSSFAEGYQSVPVDWGVNSKRKRAFFNLLSKITGSGE